MRRSRSSRVCGSRYEDHHRVIIPDETLIEAAKLSERYITDRFLPDKAIDVIDEAGARARLAAQVPPPEVAEPEGQAQALSGDKKQAVRTRIPSAPPRCAIPTRAPRPEIRRKQEEWDASARPPAHDQRGRRRVHRVAVDGNSRHAPAGSGDRAPLADGRRAA